MPSNLVKSQRDEQLWNKAKSKAAEQNAKPNYALVNHIYQRMKAAKKNLKPN